MIRYEIERMLAIKIIIRYDKVLSGVRKRTPGGHNMAAISAQTADSISAERRSPITGYIVPR